MDTTPQDIADPESDFEEQFDEHEEETEDDITGADEDPARIPSPIPAMSARCRKRTRTKCASFTSTAWPSA
jgi:hypothetical protein